MFLFQASSECYPVTSGGWSEASRREDGKKAAEAMGGGWDAQPAESLAADGVRSVVSLSVFASHPRLNAQQCEVLQKTRAGRKSPYIFSLSLSVFFVPLPPAQ